LKCKHCGNEIAGGVYELQIIEGGIEAILACPLCRRPLTK